MEAGKLNRRITLEERTTQKNAYGHEIDAWTPLATIWASVKPIGGREKLRANAIGADLTHTVLVRYQKRFLPPTYAAALRISYDGRIFNIVSARDVDEAHREIVFDCVEGSADGQ